MINRKFITNICLAATVTVGLATAVVQPALAKECAGATTAIVDCEGKSGKEAIFSILRQVVQILTMGIGVVAVGAVAYGGILFATSGDRPDHIKKAREVWINVVIGLLLYGFFVALTEFLIPGGVFR